MNTASSIDTTQTAFAQLMQTIRTQWALEVSDIHQFGPLSRIATPYVAFTRLALPPECRAYIDGIDYNRDFPSRTNKDLAEVRKGSCQLYYDSTRWHRDPALSHQARAELTHELGIFLPPAPAKPVLIEQLTDKIAHFASAVNRANLSIHMRAYGPHYTNELSFHCDRTEDFSAGIYLRGTTSLHEPPLGSIPAGPMKSITTTTVSGTSRKCRSTPTGTMAIWPTLQPHSEPLHMAGATRLAIFIFARKLDRAPALVPKPRPYNNPYGMTS